jgi:hypothetical protein
MTNRHSVFGFDGIAPATVCSNIFGDIWHTLTGSPDADKAKKIQNQATGMWTGGAKDPLHPNMVFDPKSGNMVPENTGVFGEIPSEEQTQLNYGSGADSINPYAPGPGYIAAKMDPWHTGTSAYDDRNASAYGGLALDPEARAGMEKSLAYSQGMQNNPFDAQAEADYQRARNKSELSRRSSTEAALSNLEGRGMSGSGDALLAQLEGAQGSAGDTYQAGLDRAAMGAARRDAAAQNAGQMSATLGQNQAQVDESKANGLDAYGNAGAQGKDAYAQWNAQHNFDTGKYNADALTQQLKDQSQRQQSVADANTGAHNQTVTYNHTQAPQQHFNNTMAAMGGATGQINNQAGTLQQTAVYPFQDIIAPTASGITKAVAH